MDKRVVLIGVFILAACCGVEPAELQGTPNSCFIEGSEALDCDMEPFYEEEFDRRILFKEVADLDLACEQKCKRSSRAFEFVTLHGLEAIQGFDFINALPGLGVMYTYDVEEIDALHSVESMVGVDFRENVKLEIIKPFASLEVLEYGASFEDNPRLKDLRALANVRQIGEIGGEYEPGLKLLNNNSLVDMTGLERVEVIGGRFQIRDQYNLESMRGLDSLREVETLAIVNSDDDPEYVKLNSLAGLESLRRIHKALVIQNAPNLRRCEAEALVAQLEEPPEEVILVNLSDEPCD
ncbi:hypothetical protein EA187_20150 [Lujinxingia sediminis]|uniref:Leucine-rich repeat domain-containing protein n=1 Tax=Lujinxingia sediminis TaxID=2480984 RepID=A0ABY0CMU3_9DELT|nr:hypothetical protein [Lujinxingia sediminis]RVU40390.1 hypothetical protein EA187_20150 [Lujinxingia sediminis]